MLTNEQRAHDIALCLVEGTLRDAERIEISLGEVLSLNLVDFYLKCYESALKELNSRLNP